MGDFFYKIFIKDYRNIADPTVRHRYGIFAGVLGIFLNIILAAVKVFIGFISGSLSVSADGLNNLSDASSSVITLIGFRLSAKPDDYEHPYGHARIEYLTGLILSVIIIFVGFSLGKSSIDKLISPQTLEISLFTIFVIVLSIPVKIFSAVLNYSIGKKISSNTLIATAVDSRNDVIATVAVVVGMILSYKYQINVDGFIGLVVSLFIVWSGIGLCKETASPLIGERPDPVLVDEIAKIILSHEDVIGIHDLMVHNYGAGKIFASAHIEVDAGRDVMDSHELVDTIEQEISNRLDIHFVSHMDPVVLDDEDIDAISQVISKVIKDFPEVGNPHDLRFINSRNRSRIIFDLIKSPGADVDEEKIARVVNTALRELNPNYHAIITFDKSYTNL